jgi:predicted transcriptional regulator
MDYQIIAESILHSERRLLLGRDGRGYIQLDSITAPLEVSQQDFERLRSMRHYRSVVNGWIGTYSEPAVQHVAD